jgi:hypothetical protein
MMALLYQEAAELPSKNRHDLEYNLASCCCLTYLTKLARDEQSCPSVGSFSAADVDDLAVVGNEPIFASPVEDPTSLPDNVKSPFPLGLVSSSLAPTRPLYCSGFECGIDDKVSATRNKLVYSNCVDRNVSTSTIYARGMISSLTSPTVKPLCPRLSHSKYKGGKGRGDGAGDGDGDGSCTNQLPRPSSAAGLAIRAFLTGKPNPVGAANCSSVKSGVIDTCLLSNPRPAYLANFQGQLPSIPDLGLVEGNSKRFECHASYTGPITIPDMLINVLKFAQAYYRKNKGKRDRKVFIRGHLQQVPIPISVTISLRHVIIIHPRLAVCSDCCPV